MENNKMLTDIFAKVGRLEAMTEQNTKGMNDLVLSIKDLVGNIRESNELSKEALEKSKSAHKRSDRLEEEIKQKDLLLRELVKKTDETSDKIKIWEEEKVSRKKHTEYFIKLILSPIALFLLGFFGWLIYQYLLSNGGF